MIKILALSFLCILKKYDMFSLTYTLIFGLNSSLEFYQTIMRIFYSFLINIFFILFCSIIIINDRFSLIFFII